VPEIEAQISIPILHIADATAQRLVQDGVSKVGLLGTQFTMEQDFYKARLSDKFGIEVIVPDKEDREIVHHVIYDELCRGIIKTASQEQYLKIIAHLHEQGAQAVILGCTEIALLVDQASTCIPLYDTAEIHAQQGVEFALKDMA
jgi:aspartate racemase